MRKLPQQIHWRDWPKKNICAQIFAAFPNDEHGQDQIRLVGGCIRNALMDKPIGDLDFATKIEPAQLMDMLAARNIRAIPTGLSHGTVTALPDGNPVEITTLRKDIHTDGRHAEVAFTKSWEEDAARRDFHFNALYMDAEGKLHDPTGFGIDEALAGQIRFVGDPLQRIVEDALRILRYLRFFAHYGEQDPDPATLNALNKQKELLTSLSAERIQAELVKLLAAENALPAMILMQDIGIDKVLFPEFDLKLEYLQPLQTIEKKWCVTPDPYLRLLTICGAREDRIYSIAKKLRFSNRETRRLSIIAKIVSDLTIELDSPRQHNLKKLAYQNGKTHCLDALLIYASLEFQDRKDDLPVWQAGYQSLQDWQPPVFPIQGKDLLARGLSPGPELGEALRGLEREWLANGFKPDKERLLNQFGGLTSLNRPDERSNE